eukprot:gene15623-21727_t
MCLLNVSTVEIASEKVSEGDRSVKLRLQKRMRATCPYANRVHKSNGLYLVVGDGKASPGKQAISQLTICCYDEECCKKNRISLPLPRLPEEDEDPSWNPGHYSSTHYEDPSDFLS